MKISGNINSSILSAASNLLQPFIPELSPATLVEALRRYEVGNSAKPAFQKPLTRKEAADFLSVSLPTLNRMLNDGRLKRITLSAGHAVRIDPVSVDFLLHSGAAGI